MCDNQMAAELRRELKIKEFEVYKFKIKEFEIFPIKNREIPVVELLPIRFLFAQILLL